MFLDAKFHCKNCKEKEKEKHFLFQLLDKYFLYGIDYQRNISTLVES